MLKPQLKPLRILYAAGPGEVIETYQCWSCGQDDPSQVSVTWSGQFYQVCRAISAKAYVLSSSRRRGLIKDEQFTIEHRPIPFRSQSGLLYHLGYLFYGVRLILTALRFRADVVVVSDGTTHWFMLSILTWLGIHIIPTLQCILWRSHLPKTLSERVTLGLSRALFAHQSTATLVMSKDIGVQVQEVAGDQCRPIVEYLPLYRQGQFSSILPPDSGRSPFRVLFAGRIQPEKGVFDLLEVAKRLAAEGIRDITFDICGRGAALESLQTAAKQAGIEDFFICHGFCDRARMIEMYSQSHVVIVPTRTDFVEGFNQVVAEGILAGRPVITSAVCPALSYVKEGVVEVPPDDVQSYGDALLQLWRDRNFYEAKRQGCLKLQEQFYDVSRSWGAALKSVLISIQQDKATI